MQITYQDREYSFQVEKITVDEWRELKRKYKMTPGQFQTGISEADPDAMTFLYVSMRRQSGDTRITLGDHVKPDIIALNQAVAASQEAEEATAADQDTEPEPDPTKASPSPAPSPGPSPQPGSPSSEGSPASTE